jgi:GDP-4-dehydro-6-deoxy-D-mannose reductase
MSASTRRTALITGAGGFVGRHLARALTGEGADVHGMGFDPPDDLFASGALNRWWGIDITSADEVRRAVAEAQADVVVHLAGQSSAGRSFENPTETFRANAVGTWNLLEAVRNGSPSARVLVIGSADVYGPHPAGTRIAEGAPFQPVSPYGLSKAVADAIAEHAARTGLDVVRTRSFAHAGPGQDARFVLPSWAHQIAAIESGRAEPVIHVGNLDVTRDVSDVRDVVRAYHLLIERGRSGAAYNVCRGEGYRLGDLLGRLTAMANVPVRVEVDASRQRPVDLPYLVGDPTAIWRDVGWSAGFDVEATLAAVLEDARERAADVTSGA